MRLLPLEAQYVRDALEDWLEDNPDVRAALLRPTAQPGGVTLECGHRASLLHFVSQPWTHLKTRHILMATVLSLC